MATRTKVMVVDGDQGFCNTLSSHLASHFMVVSCTNGIDALRRAAGYLPDVVLCAVELADTAVDGIATLRLIRNDPLLSHTPVIILSHRAGRSLVEQARAAGAFWYIRKDAVFQYDLIGRIRHAVRSGMDMEPMPSPTFTGPHAIRQTVG
ncbi:MAG TPA: response regulator [Planctomycetaceae bacterium]|nr:response regulator [Planctomycetaceae bacterium]